MANFLLDMIGRQYGLTDEEITKVEAAIPVAQQLMAVLQKGEPLINEALPLIQQLTPVVNIILAAAKGIK